MFNFSYVIGMVMNIMNNKKNIFTRICLGCISLLLILFIVPVKSVHADTVLYGMYQLTNGWGYMGDFDVSFKSGYCNDYTYTTYFEFNGTRLPREHTSTACMEYDYYKNKITSHNRMNIDAGTRTTVVEGNYARLQYSYWYYDGVLAAECSNSNGGTIYNTDIYKRLYCGLEKSENSIIDFGTTGAYVSGRSYKNWFLGKKHYYDPSNLTYLISNNWTPVSTCYLYNNQYKWGHGSSYKNGKFVPVLSGSSTECYNGIQLVLESDERLYYNANNNDYKNSISVRIENNKSGTSYAYITVYDLTTFNLSRLGVESYDDDVVLSDVWTSHGRYGTVVGPYGPLPNDGGPMTELTVDGTQKEYRFTANFYDLTDRENVYRVHYDSRGGKLNDSATVYVRKGGSVSKPNDPTKAGYVFDGWYTSGASAGGSALYQFGSAVNSNINLFANWKVNNNVYTVEFYDGCKMYYDGQTYNINLKHLKTVEVKRNNTVSKPQDLAESGKFFLGWSTSSSCEKTKDDLYDFSKAVTKNLTLYAVWSMDYTVTFDSNGGTAVKTPVVKVEPGKLVSQPIDPTRTGYIFNGWYLNGEDYNFLNPVLKDMTLVAQWVEIKDNTITFDSDGGTPVESQIVRTGNRIIKPADPTKAGYIFDGWYYEEEKFDFEYLVPFDLTLKAKWKVAPYTIQYNANGGENAPEMFGYEKETVVSLSYPTKFGYKFVGWSTKEGCPKGEGDVTYDRGDSIKKKNLVLYACWKTEESTERCSLRSNPSTGDSNFKWLILLETILVGSLVSYLVMKKRKNSNVA